MHIAIISHARPQNVPKIQAITGLNVWWYVGYGEKHDYELHGAKNVVESGGLMASRNLALEHAFLDGQQTCVQISDDLSKLKFLINKEGKNIVTSELSFQNALGYMEHELNKTPYKLAGVAPTPNAFFYHKEFSANLFIVGDFIMIKPTELRFDENLSLKEDYDYTVQHLKTYGGVLRCNRILATFAHRTNKGGAVEYRTAEKEQQNIAYLMAKHPDEFRLNPLRPNEILLKKKTWR